MLLKAPAADPVVEIPVVEAIVEAVVDVVEAVAPEPEVSP